MIINTILEEVTTWKETKNLLTSKEWADEDSFHEELTTVLLDVHGIYVPIKKQKQFVNRVIGPFSSLSFYHFSGDTSILYAFDKRSSQNMLLENPELAQYISDASIIIKKDDEIYDGIYLSYILPEHEAIFEDYNPVLLTKETILPLPADPLEWKHQDADLRYVTFKEVLQNLLLNNPQHSIEIGGAYREEWRSFITVYYTADIDASVLAIMNYPSILAEFETKA